MGTTAGSGGTTGGTDTGSRASARDTELLARAEQLLNRHKGSARHTIRYLLTDLEDTRNQLETAKRELVEVRKKAPADGAHVLSAEEKKDWDAFKALGKKPDELDKSLKSLGELQAAEDKRQFDEKVATAADDLGWNPQALAIVLRDKGLAAEMRDAIVTDDGKRRKVQLLHVRPANKADAPWELVDQYVERELKTYLPMLTAAVADEGEGDGLDEDLEGTDDGAGDTDTAGGDAPLRRAPGYPSPRGTRSASRSSDDGVEFPAQRAPQRRGGRPDIDKLATRKNARGEYNGF